MHNGKQRAQKQERNNVGNRIKCSFEVKERKDAERTGTTGVIFCFFDLQQKPDD